MVAAAAVSALAAAQIGVPLLGATVALLTAAAQAGASLLEAAASMSASARAEMPLVKVGAVSLVESFQKRSWWFFCWDMICALTQRVVMAGCWR